MNDIDTFYERRLNEYLAEQTAAAEWEDFLHHILQKEYLQAQEPFAEADTFEDFLEYFGENFYKIIPLSEEGEEKPVTAWHAKEIGEAFLSLIENFLNERVFEKELMPSGEKIADFLKRKEAEAQEP